MGRWAQYDEDEYRLPEGMKRVGYDADTGRYHFRDEDGSHWEGPKGAKFGEITQVEESPIDLVVMDVEDVELGHEELHPSKPPPPDKLPHRRLSADTTRLKKMRTSVSSKLTSDSQIAQQVQNAMSAVKQIHTKSPELIPQFEFLTPETGSTESTIPKQRTLQDVRLQVARSVAARAIRKAQTVDGSKTGVVFTLNKSRDNFLKVAAKELRTLLQGRSYLFALTTDANATPGLSPGRKASSLSPLVFVGSSQDFIQRAHALTSSNFIGRIEETKNDDSFMWVTGVHGMGSTSFDELALRDIVTKSVRHLMEPLIPPSDSCSADQMLTNARAQLERLLPEAAYGELTDGEMPTPVFLIDIRSETDRRNTGIVKGAIHIDRNDMEWKLDPRSPLRLAIVDRYDLRLIVMCQRGNASSLAAYSLHQLGLKSATDIIGGFIGWTKAGLPVEFYDTDTSPTRGSRV